MVDGFNINSGVRRGMSRENPEGVDAGPVSLGVPTNVPFVVPADDSVKTQPSNGALQLAQTLGNINFGAIGRAWSERNEAKRKLQDEQDQAKGQADAAMLLAQTGSDLDGLFRAGKLPATASPAFRLGASIAAAQAELQKLRKEATLRASKNPEASIFNEDAEFMAPFYERLKSVRPEAVAKYFIQPMQELAADDTKRFVGVADKEEQSKFLSNAFGAFEDSITNQDPIDKALNNAVTVLKMGHQKTPETMGQLIQVAGPRIVEAARGDDGKVDLAKAGRLLAELGEARIEVDGGRKLSYQYLDAFDKVSSYVYGSVNRAATAEKEQDAAKQDESTLEYFRALRANFKNWDAGTAMEEGVKLGLTGKDALDLYKGWDSAAGNVSQEEATEDKSEANLRAFYGGMTNSERKTQEKVLIRMKNEGMYEGREKEFIRSMKILHDSMDTEENKNPINANDRTIIRKTLSDQMSLIFGSSQNMIAALRGATNAYGLKSGDIEQVRTKVSEQLSEPAITWMMQQPEFSTYQDALANVSVDQGAPTRIIRNLAHRFLSQNSTALSQMVPKALASANPDAALSTLKFGAPPPTKPAAPSLPPLPGGGRSVSPQGPAKPVAPTRNVTEDAKQAVRAKTEASNNLSPFYNWYKQSVKAKNPQLTDQQIYQRFVLLGPANQRKLLNTFNKKAN